VVITLVALAGMRSVAMESRMSASSYDRSLAFQSSETGVREAEAMAAAASSAAFPAIGCAAGYCAERAAADTARWADSASVSDNANTPNLIVERNGEGENWVGCGQEIPRQPNCRTPRFRVTGRSTAAGRATVILQSDVATQ
jgi:type IV pilus assembly protein PilX